MEYIVVQTSYSEERYERTEYYCPNCGQQRIYMNDLDDHYIGNKHLCLACKHAFYMPRMDAQDSDELLATLCILEHESQSNG